MLFDHIQLLFLGRAIRPWTQTGQHGVTIFFVLSGFLITSTLIEGPSDLKSFYIRRFFRLMPAAWLYLATLLLMSRLTGKPITTFSEVRSCLFFYRNMVEVPGIGLAGHFWSLSLEEQFYLAWPPLLLLAGFKRCRWIAALAACACASFRWVFWVHYDQLGPNYMSQVRADALLVGCLAALLLSDPQTRAATARWVKFLALPACAIILSCIARFHDLVPLHEAVSICILITFCVLFPASVWSRLLSFRPLAWLGVVSYSVYLWQELFVQLGHSSAEKTLSLLVALPAFALGSYYLVERPSQRLGARLRKTIAAQNTRKTSSRSIRYTT